MFLDAQSPVNNAHSRRKKNIGCLWADDVNKRASFPETITGDRAKCVRSSSFLVTTVVIDDSVSTLHNVIKINQIRWSWTWMWHFVRSRPELYLWQDQVKVERIRQRPHTNAIPIDCFALNGNWSQILTPNSIEICTRFTTESFLISEENTWILHEI